MSAQVISNSSVQFDKIKRLQETFIAVTSHKFLSPITVIKWNLELLLADSAITGKQKDRLVDIQSNVQKLDDLTKLLLRIYEVATSPGDSRYTKYSLNELSNQILKEFELLINQNKIQVVNNIPSDLNVECGISESFAREVIRSIVENAIHYNRIGGVVQLDVKKINNKVEIIVSDTGVGIPEKEKDLIFNPFYRGSNVMKLSFKGNGLRLYMSKMGMNLVGGDVSFESEEGKGSKFHLLIPIKI